MAEHYLLTLSAPTEKGEMAREVRVPRQIFANDSIAPGARVLLAFERNNAFGNVESTVGRVETVDPGLVTIVPEQSLQRSVPVEQVRAIFGRGVARGANALTPEEFAQITALMGPPVIEERVLLDHVKDYVSARGYYFDDETIFNYHISLKTRPFVILAGLSGTGKSKLSQLYAEALGHTTRDGRYLRVAVRPSWNDDRYLLGYLNTITGDYVAEPALDFIIQAERDRENLYFFCLDEMNLAHVEYYFSQFLSALEEEETANRRITLFSRSLAEAMQTQNHEGFATSVKIDHPAQSSLHRHHQRGRDHPGAE